MIQKIKIHYFIIVYAAAIGMAIFYFHKNGHREVDNEHQLPTEMTCKEKTSPLPVLYGIPLDSFQTFQSTIKRNQFLADILLKYNVDYATIDKLAKKSRSIFDIRNMKAGNTYCVFYTAIDSIKKARYFVYEKNLIDYVVFDLRDTLSIYEDSKKVDYKTKTASGIINSSLYMTLMDNHLSPLLALQLADIYAWSIDFYHLQKGDRFKVIYQEKYVQGQPVGLDHINAAYFQNMGEDYYAIPFVQDGQLDYFNEKAQSLRKAFLKAPLKFSHITSHYSLRRFHPIQKVFKPHLGVDYAAPTGTPIMATGDGIVTEATYKKYNGNYVKIRHNSTYSTQYLHMSKIGKGIKAGVKVRQGQIIGYVGSTGLATGPHVCYRFWKNGKQIDPLKEKIPPSKPVKPELIPAYNKVRDSFLLLLDTISYKQPIAENGNLAHADIICASNKE